MRMIGLSLMALAFAMPAMGQAADAGAERPLDIPTLESEELDEEGNLFYAIPKATIVPKMQRITRPRLPTEPGADASTEELNAWALRNVDPAMPIQRNDAQVLSQEEIDEILRSASKDGIVLKDSYGQPIELDEGIQEIETPEANSEPAVKKAVIRKKIIMRDADGNEEIKETTEVIEGAAVDALDIDALAAGDVAALMGDDPKVMWANRGSAEVAGPEMMEPKSSIAIIALNNGVTVDAGGANVTDTVTPDGATRLIRIEPEDGGPATLITITTE